MILAAHNLCYGVQKKPSVALHFAHQQVEHAGPTPSGRSPPGHQAQRQAGDSSLPTPPVCSPHTATQASAMLPAAAEHQAGFGIGFVCSHNKMSPTC